MAVTLNASTSSGLVQTADTSGQINIQSNGTTVLGVTSTGTSVTGTQSVSGNLSFNSGYGSAATAYGCRAWVNFDGTTNTGGFCTIRGSGGVTSVADNGTGDYTINFNFTMPDTNYALAGAARFDGSSDATAVRYLGISSATSLATVMTTSSVRVAVAFANGNLQDPNVATVIVVR